MTIIASVNSDFNKELPFYATLNARLLNMGTNIIKVSDTK